MRTAAQRLIGLSAIFGVLLIAIGLLSVPGFGQAISGDLVGTVTDPTGAVVPNATVEAVNSATGVAATTKTNANGEYRFSNLPIGTYNITANSQGFAPTTVRDFRVDLNKTATAKLTLGTGQVTTTVEVSAEAPAIDTTTAQVQTTYEAVQAQNLPTAALGGANSGVLNLSLLSAGVASGGGIGAGSGPSVGGQRPRNNNFTVEGVDNNSKSVTGPLINIPNDAVSNFTVLQNQFSPEFGHSSGGQFNTVVMSGTNRLHGSAYEYFQNRNLNAVDYNLANQGIFTNPRFDSNRFGGTIGGPIIHNKWFFFFNGEYNPVGQSAVPSSAVFTPTAAGYSTLASIAGINATNLGILKQFATPAPAQATTQSGKPATITVGGQSVAIGILPISAPNFNNYKAYVGSSDFNFSEKDQLRGRYIYNSIVGIDIAPTLSTFFLPLPQTQHLLTLSEYHTFNPTVNNEFRVGFNRFAQTINAGNFKFPGLDSFPNLTFDDLNLQIGPDPNAPQFTIQNLYQATDNLQVIKGNHTFKFGAEGRKYISPQSFTQRARGDYEYGTTDLFLRDLSPDVLGERSVGNPIYYGDQIAVYSYFNDTWRVRPNVTLTLGLRHEYTTIPVGERVQSLNKIADVPGLITFDEPRAPTKNFAPRVGIAWSPSGNSGFFRSDNTAVRAGFGMAYDVLYDNIGILSLPPQLSGTQDVDLTTQSPSFLAKGGLLPSAGGLTIFPDAASARDATANHVIVDQKDPYSETWNFGIEHAFANNYSLEVRYVGTRGIHLNVQDRIDERSLVDSTHFLPTLLQNPGQAALDAMTTTLATLKAPGSLIPAYKAAGFTGPIVQFSPYGSSNYNGLQTQLTRRFVHGLQFQAAYTWSHLIDDSTADFFSTFLTPRRPQDFLNVAADRGTSALDRRHRVTISTIYDLPFFKGSGNYFLKNVVSNWEIAPIYTFESPEYADLQSSQDSNLNGDSAGDRVIINPSGAPGTGSNVTALCTSGYASSAAPANGIPCGGSGTDASGNAISTSKFVVAYLAQNPNAQYLVAGPGAFAISHRNTIATPHINNWDASLVKRINFTEGTKLEFQAQAFNVFNHPQFTPGVLNDVRSFGQAGTAIKNYLTPGQSNFLNPKTTFNSNARTMQLALKFIF
jgi:hypothetical protein